MILMWNYRMIFKFSDTQKIVKQNLVEACKISETIFFMYEWVSIKDQDFDLIFTFVLHKIPRELHFSLLEKRA